MPSTSNALSDFPDLLSLAYSHNFADNLVSRDAREGHSHVSTGDDAIRVTDARSDDFDDNLTGCGILPVNVYDLEWLASGLALSGLVGLGEGGHLVLEVLKSCENE